MIASLHQLMRLHYTLFCLLLFPIAFQSAVAALPPVVIATVTEGEVIEPLALVGTVTAPQIARLSPGVAGLVARVNAEVGDHVEAGTALLDLDDALARWSVDVAAAAADQAREELADAQRRLDDVKRLATTRAIAKTELHARESEVRIDTATLKLRQAEQQIAAVRQARHHLKAPFAGVISRKQTEVGEWIDPGDPALELIADRGLRIDFRVPQRVFSRVSTDTRIDVTLEVINGDPLPARIGAIIPISDPAARTFEIRVYPKTEALALIPGMSASATLRLDTGRRGVLVSRDALLRHPDGRVTAWVVEGEDNPSVVERQLRTGLSFDAKVVILDGLAAGERVVVEGNEALLPDQQVQIRESRP